MARSHHRKKHKEHLRQFKQKDDSIAPSQKTKATSVFIIVGAVIGMAVGYLLSNNSMMWAFAGLVAGAIGGYFFGSRADKGK